MTTVDERFDSKWEYRAPFTCWFWTKSDDGHGYGQFWDGAKNRKAHRWSYMRKHGIIPDGLVLDHFKCDTPGCVNPDHVRPATQRENILRGNTVAAVAASKTHCPAGHEYTEDNTSVNKKTGHRQCRECNRGHARKQHAKRLARAQSYKNQ